MITPSDQAARSAVVERLDENMVVVAGAGTGKTRCLVDRVVALITSGRARMGGVAAITFTEAAAAELSTRIGESLERSAEDGGLGQEERANCKRAVEELDQAAIQTLHSFAGSLLARTSTGGGPAAGLHHPRRVRSRDRIRGAAGRSGSTRRWTTPTRRRRLRPALAEGMTLKHLRDIAVSFHEQLRSAG